MSRIDSGDTSSYSPYSKPGFTPNSTPGFTLSEEARLKETGQSRQSGQCKGAGISKRTLSTYKKAAAKEHAAQAKAQAQNRTKNRETPTLRLQTTLLEVTHSDVVNPDRQHTAAEHPAAKQCETKQPKAAARITLPASLRSIISRRDTWLGRGDLQRDIPSRAVGDSFENTGINENAGTASAANSDLHFHQNLPTGFPTLDAKLCEQGWPLGTTIEVMSDATGMGAMGLFLPAMEKLCRQQRWQAFIAPPYTPYAPLLAARGIDTQQVLLVHPRSREEQLWSTEQTLRSGNCSAVFCWLGHGEYRYAELRRLQLAAARGNTLAVLFRSQDMAQQHAPAALRLQMRAYREVHILKQRSGLQGINVYLPPENDIPHQPQLWELPADGAVAQSQQVAG